MKTQTAINIAETLWADTVREGSLFDSMMKLQPEIILLMQQGKYKEIDAKITDIRSEIVARWANIIMEVEGKDEDKVQDRR